MAVLAVIACVFAFVAAYMYLNSNKKQQAYSPVPNTDNSAIKSVSSTENNIPQQITPSISVQANKTESEETNTNQKPLVNKEVSRQDIVPVRTNKFWKARLERKPRYEGFSGGKLEEVIISSVEGAGHGGIPPTPLGDEESLRKGLQNAITNDIIIYDTDDEQTVALKEKVAQIKYELQEIVDEGGSIKEALNGYKDLVNDDIEKRRSVTSEFIRIRKEASLDEALAYLEEANKALEAEGVEPVVFNPNPKPRFNPKRKQKENVTQ